MDEGTPVVKKSNKQVAEELKQSVLKDLKRSARRIASLDEKLDELYAKNPCVKRFVTMQRMLERDRESYGHMCKEFAHWSLEKEKKR